MSHNHNVGAEEARVLELVRTVISVGQLPDLINQYAAKGEINAINFTQEIKDAMASHLLDMGIDLEQMNDEEFEFGNYDELFAMAYQAARSAVSGEDDPLDNARNNKTNLANSWDFSVDSFETLSEQGVLPVNILASGAADYLFELGERLGIFRLADAIVLNWSSGAIDVVDGEAAHKLYRYWKLRDDRSTEEERGMLYKRVLNKGNASVLDRMVSNEYFMPLWQNLMSEAANYIDKAEKLDEGVTEASPVSRSRIHQATRELQYNLTEYCTGMAHMQVREVYSQLQEAISILQEEEILAHFGGSRRKTMWSVIEQLSKTEFGSSPNIAAHRSLAVDGNKIFQWIANYDESTSTQDEFMEFLLAAESYILNMSVIDDPIETSYVTEDEQQEYQDDFDDFGDDF